ncbi:MAG: DUF2231 domain-containing protein [Thermomicrobiales bacterium]
MMRRRRFLGHPIHPIFTDFPIALLPLALLWEILGWVRDDGFWWKAAFWTLIAGLTATIPAAVSGFVEYFSLDPKSSAFQRATNHMMIMLTAVLLFAGTAFAQGGPSTASGGRAMLAIGLGVLGSLCLGIGGWLGGEMVFGHGVGVAPHVGTESKTHEEAPTKH